jgi:biotin carboxyl carrier protein
MVTLDGRELYVELAAVDGSWSMLVGAGPAEAGAYARPPGSAEAGAYVRPSGSVAPSRFTSYEIAVDDRGGGERVVFVDGRPVAVRVRDARARFGRRSRVAPSAAGGSGSIAAPMPGRIVKVLVGVGDTVSAGQGLLVVEAMKMENELRAPRPGIVADLRVAEGQSVEAGALLVMLDPEP